MELQFDKSEYSCLQKVLGQVQQQEETQELRISDGMPDIGSVLGAWGQPLIRSKEWRGNGITVSGGVMAWVLYAPEDEGQPQCVQTWIPFQMKWDFPDPGRDGVIRVHTLLRSMDARSTSARKLMLRAGIGMLAEAYAPGQVSVYAPGEIPDDVQLLINTYPVRMPAEAGEKMVALDEELTLPGSYPKPEKLIRYSLCPELVDKKVMTDKAVFRGAAILHVLYAGEDGGMYSWDFEIPFSQFAELDKEYDQDASVNIIPAITSLELEIGENGLHLKASMTGQYVIMEKKIMDIVEDAYSPRRTVTPQYQQMEMPMVLEEKTETVRAEQILDIPAERVADITFTPDFPEVLREQDLLKANLGGQYQMLYYDTDGVLQGVAPRWSDQWSVPAGENSRMEIIPWSSGVPQATVNGASGTLRSDILLDTMTSAQQGMTAVSGLVMGELEEPDPNRPSLILRKSENQTLWEMAKETGSTVEAIRNANRLSSEPEDDRILLIPVS